MVHRFIDGTFRQTNLTNETQEYLAKREELRLAEIDLMEQRERVAELRRRLPPGAPLPEYEFLEMARPPQGGAEPTATTLSELFTANDRPLVIYHLMFGKKQVKPCPMCTLWIDGYSGVAKHLAQNVDFVIVAAAAPQALQAYATERGWNDLRCLSAAPSTFKYDLGSEDASGAQDSQISVFTKDTSGAVRHFYSAHPRMGPDIKERGLDILTPVWNLLDLTPQGRGQWYAALDYGPKSSERRGEAAMSLLES
jgi:predicted dithiol-disulfide oxidoreductase (DUF899 family)